MRQFLYLVIFIGGVFALLNPAPASAAATCANIRCASGSCIDTPSGPTCQPHRLTCASTLCIQGTICTETSTGPVCKPQSQTPIQPAPPVYSGGSDGCYLVKDYSYGHAFNRRVCPPRRAVTPRNHYRPHYNMHRRNDYGHRYNNRYPRYGSPRHYTPPAPTPAPQPNPGNGMVCPQHYAPVCAQKAVQCVRAPCPAVKQTFGNSCMASAQGYSVLYNGTCR